MCFLWRTCCWRSVSFCILLFARHTDKCCTSDLIPRVSPEAVHSQSDAQSLREFPTGNAYLKLNPADGSVAFNACVQWHSECPKNSPKPGTSITFSEQVNTNVQTTGWFKESTATWWTIPKPRPGIKLSKYAQTKTQPWRKWHQPMNPYFLAVSFWWIAMVTILQLLDKRKIDVFLNSIIVCQTKYNGETPGLDFMTMLEMNLSLGSMKDGRCVHLDCCVCSLSVQHYSLGHKNNPLDNMLSAGDPEFVPRPLNTTQLLFLDFFWKRSQDSPTHNTGPTQTKRAFR